MSGAAVEGRVRRFNFNSTRHPRRATPPIGGCTRNVIVSIYTPCGMRVGEFGGGGKSWGFNLHAPRGARRPDLQVVGPYGQNHNLARTKPDDATH